VANKCDYCNKGKMHGQKVSHAKNRSKRVFKPNLHRARIMVDGVKEKLTLCTKCLRTLKKKNQAK